MLLYYILFDINRIVLWFDNNAVLNLDAIVQARVVPRTEM